MIKIKEIKIENDPIYMNGPVGGELLVLFHKLINV